MQAQIKKHNTAGCPFCRAGIPLAEGTYTYSDPDEALAKLKAPEAVRAGRR